MTEQSPLTLGNRCYYMFNLSGIKQMLHSQVPSDNVFILTSICFECLVDINYISVFSSCNSNQVLAGSQMRLQQPKRLSLVHSLFTYECWHCSTWN